MAIYQGNGTWGPQTGILGFFNPFSRDISFTENALTVASRGAPQQASNWYNPKAIANANPQPQVYTIGGTQTKINGITPKQLESINRQNAITGGSGGSSGASMATAANVNIGGDSGGSDINYQDLYAQQVNNAYNEIASQLDRMAGLLPG